MMDAEILERINRGIILRTGAYLTNDHFVLPSGRHTQEYVEKALATTEPAFTEGLGDVIAKHFAEEPIDLILTTGYGASLLGHCVARAHPLRPRFIYANKQRTDSGASQVALPREFRQYFVGNPRVLIVEDIMTTGETVKGLIKLVKSLGGTVVGIGTLWRRMRKVNFKFPFFTLVDREFPTYTPKDCPMCRRGIPINQEFLTGPGPQKSRRVRAEAH
jgi:orotate phosphoribosyltransferase